MNKNKIRICFSNQNNRILDVLHLCLKKKLYIIFAHFCIFWFEKVYSNLKIPCESFSLVLENFETISDHSFQRIHSK